MAPSGRPRRRAALWLGAAALAAVLAGAVLGAWYWGGGDTDYRPATSFMAPTGVAPAITYEEPRAPSPPAGGLMAVDEAVFDALHEAGVDREHITLRLVPGDGGEITEIEALLGPGQDAGALAAALDRHLAGTGVVSAWRDIDGGRLLTIRKGPRLTHKVSLLFLRQPLEPPRPPAAPAPSKGPRAAIIIDDMGYQLEPARELLGLDLGLTYSVLPFSPHGVEIAKAARRKGREVLVHLPMQPRSYPKVDPGPGALFTNMSPGKLERTAGRDLDWVPDAVGVNNHMGSSFTEDAAALKPVMRAIHQRGMFFIDSLTSPHSRALAAARQAGVPARARQIFLDHDPSPRAVRRQLRRLMALARRRDGVIAIGHPHPATINVLTEMAPELRKRLSLVPASRLVRPAPHLTPARPGNNVGKAARSQGGG